MTHLAAIRVSEPQNNSENNGTNFTWGRTGPIAVIRCFVHMVAYVTKAGLGPEPDFALLCRSFCRWSGLILRHYAYLLRLYCPLIRWSRLNLRRKVSPGRSVPSLFKLRQGVWRFERLPLRFGLLHFFDTTTVGIIELKIKQIDRETKKL